MAIESEGDAEALIAEYCKKITTFVPSREAKTREERGNISLNRSANKIFAIKSGMKWLVYFPLDENRPKVGQQSKMRLGVKAERVGRQMRGK